MSASLYENKINANETPPGWVDFDFSLVEALIDTIDREEQTRLLDSWDHIAISIIDVFDGMSYAEILATQGGDTGALIQAIFHDMERLLPYYIPLLRTDMDREGDETYRTREDVMADTGIDASTWPASLFPKLLLENSDREFALMQVAAFQAGIPDTYLRLWYLFLTLLIGSHLANQASVLQ